jgi:N-acetylglucosaminyl-diphospho-decaprenol L-rhamnosyltransferase
VAAVVLHYRFWPGVKDCLDALAAQSRLPDRVVVVDNCSGDGSMEHVRRDYPRFEVIESPHNGGYSSGMNLGLEHLAASTHPPEAVLLLTHDCHLAPDAVEHLARRLEVSPRTGAVGPLLSLHEEPRAVYMAGGTIDPRTWDGAHPVRPGPRDPGMEMAEMWAGRGPHSVRWLDGACALVRTPAWREVGRLDERYFLYYEDMDYGLRLGARGWAVECVPSARAWHQHGQPSPLLDYLAARNHLLLIREHAPARFCMREILRDLSTIARDLTSRDPRRAVHARATATALIDFSLRRFGPPNRTL